MTKNFKKNISILGHDIPLGTSKEINFNIAKLHTATIIEVPVIIERSKKAGPTILFTAGIHGDEINGVDIVRQIISKKINKPKRGSIICMPILNVFGFLNSSRSFPDGRDLNRVFPGSANGSLASRVANRLMTEIIPDVDLIIDFHTGGASRFNAAQIRIVKDKPELEALASVFGAPFTLYSSNIGKSFRNACHQLGKPILLFEGGKSFFVDDTISKVGIEGVKRILSHFDMLNPKKTVSPPKDSTVFVDESKWIRAKHSGMFKAQVAMNTKVSFNTVLGQITDPYGKVHHHVKSTIEGYIINVNEASLVYQGDALFHITTKIKS
ncbi:MAG: succinylglutamate desuccinylase/aspartoacylase family protein [Flavobacteriales bacterium]|nr:succinylglutamate desuccinylase/aspartoacylase family protein [Flavobacteriia bacterium]NCP06415.1 succinylglutamate desuccinylase/aspartoacylase family protein [Flavobacteriales bacterium]PIV93927.1 MAG: succinylglutamate desuccinylase [Flavobacteriaceae bacterium CG17_big_fil_post_rev_8_21_14_2_50_33_15]PIY13528.1 MAG: succinylglutamate desuccinylase [Flavobacteriaceae bacterium CG_4_10_14_3_um_filter_33_47]PJB18955.1 MAG: succinylglutamate desuccinylase [Flavobacteriaceae bacterium CG_4_9